MPKAVATDNAHGGPEQTTFALPGYRRITFRWELGYYSNFLYKQVARAELVGISYKQSGAHNIGADGIYRGQETYELGPGTYTLKAWSDGQVYARAEVEWSEPAATGATAAIAVPVGATSVVGGGPVPSSPTAPVLAGMHGLFAPEIRAELPSERSLAAEGDTLRLYDFSGGLNRRDHDWLLTPSESPDLLNVRASLRAALELRKGYQRVLDVSDPAAGPVVRLFYHMFPSGEAYVFAVRDASDGYRLYAHSPDGTFTALLHTWSPKPKHVSFAAFRGYVYVAASGHPMLRISHANPGVPDLGVAQLSEAWIQVWEEPFDKDWPGQWKLTENRAWWSHSITTDSSAQYGAYVLQLQAKSGAQLFPVALEWPLKLPIAGHKLYRLTIAVRSLAGSSAIYMGARVYDAANQGMGADGSTTPVEQNIANQHWFAAKYTLTGSTGWVVYTGYARGFAATGSTSPSHNPNSPGRFHERAVYMSPLVGWYPQTDNASVLVDIVEVSMLGEAPPRPGFLAEYGNRLVGAHEPLRERHWFFSELHSGEVWSTYEDGDASDTPNEDEINEGSGEEITGLAKVTGGLLMFTDTDTFLLTGVSPDQWRIVHLSSDTGCIAPASIAIVGGRAIWLSHRGVMMADADGISNPPLSSKVQSILDAYTVKELSRAAAVATGEYYYLFLPRRGSVSELLECALVYDLRRGAWWWDEGYRFRCAAVAVLQDALVPIAGLGNATAIVAIERGTTDDGAAIMGYWRSKRWYRDAEEIYRRLAYIAVQRVSWADQLPVRLRLDYETPTGAAGSQSMDLTAAKRRGRLTPAVVSTLSVRVEFGAGLAPDLEGFVLEARPCGRWRRRPGA